MSAVVQLRLLGPLVLTGANAELPADLYWRKPLALLIYLACSGAQPRSRAHLAELLWPEGNAARSLNQALVPIRRAVGESALQGDRDTIQLVPDAVALDTAALTRALDARQWNEAAALVRGPFCDGFEIRGAPAFEQWMTLQRRSWCEVMVGALLRHADELAEAGSYRKGAEVAGRALELDPVHEPAMLTMMQLMTLDDRPGAAVALLDAFTVQLHELTGRTPDARLVQMARRLSARTRTAPANRSPAARRAPLIARQAALMEARQCWRHARDERTASLLVLQGDPGCGRSRMVEEVAAFAALDPVTIAEVRLVRADRSVPGGVLRLLLQSGLRSGTGAVGASQATLRLLDEPGEDGSLGPAVTDLLGALLEEQPVLLLIDDAQWCDDASIDALEAILRTHRQQPLLLVLSLPRVPAVDHVDRLIPGLNRAFAGAIVTLTPFALEDIAGLVQRLLPSCDAAQQDRVARRTLADSAGLPLLVVELLHAVALGLELEEHDPGWPVPYHTLTDTLPGDLPETITAAIRVGFRQLDAAARTVLTAVAVLDAPVPRSRIEAVTGLVPHRIDNALDQLVWQRWLQGDARGYACVAQVARQVIARDMVSPSQRQILTQNAS